MATKKEKTREAILDASYGLFAKKGFKQVKIYVNEKNDTRVYNKKTT